MFKGLCRNLSETLNPRLRCDLGMHLPLTERSCSMAIALRELSLPLTVHNANVEIHS